MGQKDKKKRQEKQEKKSAQHRERHVEERWSAVLGWCIVVLVGVVAVMGGFLGSVSGDWYCLASSASVYITDLEKLKIQSGSQSFNETMLWGSYRPQNYFGLRTREHQSFLFALGWGTPGDIRYTAEDDDSIIFQWHRHDGVRFGVQEIVDKKHAVDLQTSFIKTSPKDWSVRVRGKRTGPNPHPILLAPVFSSEYSDISIEQNTNGVALTASTPEAGRFTVTLDGEWTVRRLRAPKTQEWDVKWNTVFRGQPPMEGEPNQVVLIRKVSGDFSLDVTLSSHGAVQGAKPFTGCRYVAALEGYRLWFEGRYGEVFGSSNEMGMHALSSLLGGMGYWYGTALKDKGGIIAAQSLYSAVPSRSKFPRGFLWDEGFHQLAISKWYPEIGKDVIKSWLTQMEPSGWIPREQIRGNEPRSRVPMEFVPQNPTHANPPTLLLQIQNFAMHNENGKHTAFLKSVWPYLKRWYSWWRRTQAGSKEHTYKWMGRSGYHLLSCGLDDYPRSRCDSEDEAHVDLLSWMVLMSDTMSRLAGKLQDDAAGEFYNEESGAMRAALKEHHWDAVKKRFSDVSGCPAHADGTPAAKFVPFIGYVNLFPLLCGVLDPVEDREKVIAVVKLAEQHLMSGNGLRSLSAASLRKVKKHDNYWTGPVWININYMFLRAIEEYNYSSIPEAAQVAQTLRADLVSTISSEYQRTGKLWENYNATTGRGRGTAPFTGWTALVLLMDP